MVEQINRTKEIFKNFDATNNGVIYIKEKQLKGGKKKPLNTCAIAGYSENPISICSNKDIIFDINTLNIYINSLDQTQENYIKCDFKHCGNNTPSNRNIDDILLKNYIVTQHIIPDNEKTKGILPISDINLEVFGDNLKQYIDINKTPETVTNKLRFDKHGKYELSKLQEAGNRDTYTQIVNGRFNYDYKHEGENEWVQDFSHNGYNKDIVQAYEKNFIDNFPRLPQFINKQYEHIGKMTLTDKIVINDYTKKSCFHFYLAYASKLISEAGLKEIMNGDGRWITGYKIDQWYDDPHNEHPELYGFGDSFFKQILEVIEINRFNEIIIEKLKHPGYDNVQNITDYWNFLLRNGIERVSPNDVSIFADKLTPVEWDTVMRKFITDIDKIIANAPPTESVIYCYRAVSVDYINLHLRDDILNIGGPDVFRTNEGTYVNTRIGSLSLNYDSSVRYLKGGTMYRAYIMDGVRVLYIPSLSYASDEFEILHGSYGIFVDKKDNYKCYNNKKNKYGILSYRDDQFNSAIVGLAGYSKNIKSAKFAKIADTLQELFNSVKETPESPETSEETSETNKSLKNIYKIFNESIEKSDAANKNIKKIISDAKGVELVEDNTDTLNNDVVAIERYYEAISAARAAEIRRAAEVRRGGAAKKGAAKKGVAKKNNRIF